MQTFIGEQQSKPAQSLSEAIAEDTYGGYAYAYPHKTSYRHLEPAVPLRDAWRSEEKSKLFLYVHLPFCEMRCGFCNLFTTSQPASDFVQQTLEAISRQSRVTTRAIAPERIVQVAIGGGTPTYLDATELRYLFEMIHGDWPIDRGNVPFSMEVSPATVDAEKLRVATDNGVRRISMGVQSFVASDLGSLGRPQKINQVHRAIETIRKSDAEIFNLDLIYGNEGQTEADWIFNVEQALSHRPEELFLYPLYVRQLTGLGRRGRNPADNRRHLYQMGRDLLTEAGYLQISMRMFRRRDVSYESQHCCQEDGMIGLGPGARSYTRGLHYSSEYAVSGGGVRKIIAEYNRRTEGGFSNADYGVHLNGEEQARRYLIRSLLQVDGLDCDTFRQHFGEDVVVVIPQVDELVDSGFARRTPNRLTLTADGLAHSDVIGPWLYSPSVRNRMNEFALR
ncbi:MAG: STM4012 family radical SAM protein [Planctomycetota bacterium]